MKLYRVYVGSYEGEYTHAVFDDEATAISFARAEARDTNEEFGGGIGYGVGIEVLWPGGHERLEGWADWKIEMKGAHVVLSEDA